MQRKCKHGVTVRTRSLSIRMLLLSARWASPILKAILFARARYYSAELALKAERIIKILAHTFCLDYIIDDISVKQFRFTKQDIQTIFNTIL